MTTALAGQFPAATNAAFVQTVQMAIVGAALAIQSETPAFANHANRSAYAKLVLNDPGAYAPLFAFAVASQGIDANATDVMLANTVSAVWNGLAGVL